MSSSNPKKSSRKSKQKQTQRPHEMESPAYSPQPAPPANIFQNCYQPLPVPPANQQSYQHYGFFQPQPPPMTYLNQQSSPYQSPPTYNAPQFTRMQPQRESDSEFETFVPETQPPPSTETADSSGKALNLPWEQIEERILGKSWVDVSEDPIYGNDQKSAGFWGKVAKRFLSEMGRGPYRTEHSIATKWRNTNRIVLVFNSIYNNTKNNWGSGQNDERIVAKAREIFQLEQKKAFRHEAFWEVVRESSKWQQVNTSETYTSGSKRTKTSTTAYTSGSGSANFGLNLNDDDSTDEERAPRKMGRDKAKGKQQANLRGSNSDDLKAMATAVSGFQSHLSLYDTLAIEKQKSRDLKNFQKDVSHLTGEMYEQAMKAKAEIAKKYGW